MQIYKQLRYSLTEVHNNKNSDRSVYAQNRVKRVSAQTTVIIDMVAFEIDDDVTFSAN